MADTILVDTGFWIGLFEPGDANHLKANQLVEYLDFHTILIPWPTLYEFVNTRLTRRADWANRFRNFTLAENTQLVTDEPYRPTALHGVFGNPRGHYSLTDFMLRSMIEDTNLRINALITFNEDDFMDVCIANKVELIGGRNWE